MDARKKSIRRLRNGRKRRREKEVAKSWVAGCTRWNNKRLNSTKNSKCSNLQVRTCYTRGCHPKTMQTRIKQSTHFYREPPDSTIFGVWRANEMFEIWKSTKFWALCEWIAFQPGCLHTVYQAGAFHSSKSIRIAVYLFKGERERAHIKLICRTQCRGGVHSSTKKRIALHCGFHCARSSSRSKVQLNGERVSSGMQATIVPRYCACLTQSLFRLCASCKVSSDPERFECGPKQL